MVEFIAEDSNMVGFVYFNFDKEADWKVWDGFEVSEGWAEAMQLPAVSHQWPLTAWFEPGPIPFDPAPPPLPPVQVAPAIEVIIDTEQTPEPAFIGTEVATAPAKRIDMGGVRPE